MNISEPLLTIHEDVELNIPLKKNKKKIILDDPFWGTFKTNSIFNFLIFSYFPVIFNHSKKILIRFFTSFSFFVIIIQTIIFFITIGMGGFDIHILNKLGGKNAYLIIMKKEFWRLITSMFISGGFFHYIMEIWAEFRVCTIREATMGQLYFLELFIASGIGGNIMSTYIFPHKLSIGASGSIIGVLTNWFISMLTNFDRKKITNISLQIILIVFFSVIPGVDWACHLGGFLTGLILGIPFISLLIRRLLLYSIFTFSILLMQNRILHIFNNF